MKEVTHEGQVLARHIPGDAWGDGLAFYSKDEDFIQVGTWRYAAGKELLAHAHNEAARNVPWTQEVLFIRKGRILAHVYSPSGTKLAQIEARAGDVLVMLAGGHGYTILDDGTEVLEVKNGPYLGAEVDRRRFQPVSA